MTFVVTKVQAYGIEAEEPINKRYRQYLILNVTAANTDVDLDLGDNQTGSLGTFWTAADDTTVGAQALFTIQDIVTRAESFDSFGGDIFNRVQADAASTLTTALNSSASSGGSASETLTVTGLQTTDTVISAYLVANGASGLYLSEAASACSASGQYAVTFDQNPGAGAIVRVGITRAAGSKCRLCG